MGKRKSTAVDSLSSPTKKNNGIPSHPVKVEKRSASSDSDSDGFEETVEDHAEVDDTTFDVGQYVYEPDEMRLMCESFSQFIKDRKSVSVSNIEKTATEWALTVPESRIDVSMFIADFKKYLKTSTRLKNFQTQDASSAILHYLSSEKSLADFKSFPAKPVKKIHLYCKKKNITFRPTEIKSAYDQIRGEDSAVIAELDEEIRTASANYASALQEFIEKHPNLTEEQNKSLKGILNRVQKKAVIPTPKTPRANATKKSKKPETAFSLFCRTKADKYTDLSEEEREKKLRKKFSKLSAPQLDILEGLALNM